MSPLPPPPPAPRTNKATKLSQTSVARFDDVSLLMQSDKVLEEKLYSLLHGKAKKNMYKCILFLYGFMEKQRLLKGHSWGVIVPSGDDRDPYKLDVIDNPSAEDRIAFVRTMTVEDRNCRKRLLEIAEIDNVGGDKNLLAEQSKAYYGFLANHVRCLLRFFAKENSFGFKPDMTDAIFSLCIQQWENCFLIAACGLVDLQMQRDLNMTDAQKYQCLDKSQVARRIMSAEDLMKYVYCDKGNSSIEMVLKLLGGRPGSEEEYLHVFRHKNDFVDEMIDFVFNRHLGRSGAGLVSFDVTVNFAPNQNRPDINKIPCFDGGRGSAPVGFSNWTKWSQTKH